MASVAPSSSSKKRPLSVFDEFSQPTKKSRHSYNRQHAIHHPQQTLPGAEPALIAQTSVQLSNESTDSDEAWSPPHAQLDEFLGQSIVSICQNVGRKEGIDDATIEGWAIEKLRSAAEEYTLEICRYVRRSMLSARRIAPIATDFESAFDILSIPTPEDQLPPRLRTTPKPALEYLPTPPPEEFFNAHQLPESLLGSDLSSQNSATRKAYIPSTFPAFPSQHTFRHTTSTVAHEMNPRKVREGVAVEGKLAEEALRRLAGGANRRDERFDFSSKPASDTVARGKGSTQEIPTIDEAFEDAMKALLDQAGMGPGTEAGKDFQMAPIVNSERKYWMPEGGRRKAVGAPTKDTGQSAV